MQLSYSEKNLLDALSAGQIAAFDRLYQQYKQPVYANILKMVKHTEAAEDLLQEVFIALWENRHGLARDQAVGGWLFVVSYNKAASYLRKKLTESLVVVVQPELADALARDEPADEELYTLQLAMVEEAVRHLPARKREVFRLCRFEGKSYEEVAATIGISVASVKDYLKQSTRFIREHVRAGYDPSQAVVVVGLLVLMDMPA